MYCAFIKHHGVPGMQWGHRKDSKSFGIRKRRSSLNSNVSIARRSSNNYSNIKKVKRKRIKEMSDSELLKTRDRLRLEREVKILSSETGSTAKKIATQALQKAAGRALEEVAHDTVKYIVGEQVINRYAGTKVVNIGSSEKDKKKKKDN